MIEGSGRVVGPVVVGLALVTPAPAWTEPLDHLPGLSLAQRARLRMRGISTVEQLAARPYRVDGRDLSTRTLRDLNRRMRRDPPSLPAPSGAPPLWKGKGDVGILAARGQPDAREATGSGGARPQTFQRVSIFPWAPEDQRYQLTAGIGLVQFLAPFAFSSERVIAARRRKEGKTGPDWHRPLRMLRRVLTGNGALVRWLWRKNGISGIHRSESSLDIRLGPADLWVHSTIQLELPEKHRRRARALAEFQLRSAVVRYFDGRFELVETQNPSTRRRVHVDVDIQAPCARRPNHRLEVTWDAGGGATSNKISVRRGLNVWAHEAGHFLFGAVDEYGRSFKRMPRGRLMMDFDSSITADNNELRAVTNPDVSPSCLLNVARAVKLATGRTYAVARARP